MYRMLPRCKCDWHPSSPFLRNLHLWQIDQVPFHARIKFRLGQIRAREGSVLLLLIIIKPGKILTIVVAVNITDVYTTYFPVGQPYVYVTCGRHSGHAGHLQDTGVFTKVGSKIIYTARYCSLDMPYEVLRQRWALRYRFAQTFPRRYYCNLLLLPLTHSNS
jgi:hypothetical protein